jgi:alpha-tubulin suppressor-like RCC1 family protein
MKKRLIIIFLFISQCFFAQQLSSGSSHNAVIKNDGTLWAWGNNSNSQLGDGTNINKNSPIKIGSNYDWKTVYTGYRRTFAIKNNGTLWGWGNNFSGQLGDGTTITKATPTQIGIGNDWEKFSTRSSHSLAIKKNGTLWAWGYNGAGQLGDGTTTSKLIPKQIGVSSNWKSISVGSDYSIALKTDGTLWAWGYNLDGQLGDGTNINKLTPIQIGTANNWAYVATGDNYTLALKTDGTLWGWGNNSSGQIGDGTTINKLIPTKIDNSTNWKIIIGYGNTSLAIKTDNTLWGWGSNPYGILGDGTTNNINIPNQIGTDTDWDIATLGSTHLVAMKKNSSLYAWGSNLSGQLGDGVEDVNAYPRQVGNLRNWKSAAAGANHSLAIKTDGTLWAWGARFGEKFSDGTLTNKNSPTQIGTETNWKIIVVGYGQNFALKNDGTLWGWGDNSSGLLGDGTKIDRNYPIQIGINFNNVFTGLGPNFALKNDGTLWGWGNNVVGQLGDGSTNDRLIPTKIGTSLDWTIVAPSYNTQAIKTDGTLWEWGIVYSQIRNTPIRKGLDSNWYKVTCGLNNFVGLKNDRTLWTWGQNYFGGDFYTPVRVGNTNDFLTLSTGAYHSLTIKADGTLWAWGENTNAQIGNGLTSNYENIIKIGTDNDWKVIAAGANHSLAIKNNGSLWSWGGDDNGQLGNGILYVPKSIQFSLGCITPDAPTGDATQAICSSATIANLVASGTANKWYSTAIGGSALASTTALVNGTTYYASQTINSCESASRFAVTVSITNTAAPTDSATQAFCSSATIANLTASGTAIKWYATATGGSALSGTTALVNGTTYYASQTVNSCESASRLGVTVTITNTAVPTGSAAQNLAAGSTLSNIVVTGTAIQWYATATGGNPLTNTTPLVNGGIYYGSQTVNGCQSQSRFMVTVTVNPFTLPYNNFSIETKSETCASKNNGQIIINATQTYNYTATINSTNYTFVNNSLTVSNLAPGVYTICIGVTGKTFEQCYSVTIGKGGSITGKSSFNSNKEIVEITEGTAPFEILVNGKSQFETSETNFAVDIKQGDLLEVKTAIACEGIYAKTILDGLVGVQVYPNPTAGLFEITIPTSKTEVEVEIYSIGTQLISKRKYPVINQRVRLSLENESDGVYFAKINLDSPVSLTIIKKS